MEFDDEERPLGDFGSLLGVPAGDSEETGLEEELDVSTGVKQRAWLVKVGFLPLRDL